MNFMGITNVYLSLRIGLILGLLFEEFAEYLRTINMYLTCVNSMLRFELIGGRRVGKNPETLLGLWQRCSAALYCYNASGFFRERMLSDFSALVLPLGRYNATSIFLGIEP